MKRELSAEDALDLLQTCRIALFCQTGREVYGCLLSCVARQKLSLELARSFVGALAERANAVVSYGDHVELQMMATHLRANNDSFHHQEAVQDAFRNSRLWRAIWFSKMNDETREAVAGVCPHALGFEASPDAPPEQRDAVRAWRGEFELVYNAVRSYGGVLRHADPALRGNIDVVHAAICNWPPALQYAEGRAADDRYVVQTAVARDGLALQHAEQKFREDTSIVEAAVERNPGALAYAAENCVADLGNERVFELLRNMKGSREVAACLCAFVEKLEPAPMRVPARGPVPDEAGQEHLAMAMASARLALRARDEARRARLNE